MCSMRQDRILLFIVIIKIDLEIERVQQFRHVYFLWNQRVRTELGRRRKHQQLTLLPAALYRRNVLFVFEDEEKPQKQSAVTSSASILFFFLCVVHVAGVNKRPIRSYVYTTLP